MNNLFHIPYEPSGMQMLFYILSLPLFILLTLLSRIYCYYYDVNKLLSYGFIFVWLIYFLLLIFIDQMIHFPAGKELFYYGSLVISLGAVLYIICITYYQIKQ